MVMKQWKGETVALLYVLAMVSLRGVAAHRVGEKGILYHDEQGRVVIEGNNISESALNRRTERVDPLDHLKKYRGGFNITNKHYWSSTIFTGKFGYIIAVAWLFSGLIYTSVLIISYISFYFKRKNEENKAISFKRSYNLSLLLEALLTFLAIIASGMALNGSNGFHSRAMAIDNIMVDVANNASGTISTVSESVEVLQNDTQISQNVENSSSLQLTTKKLNDEASSIQMKAGTIMRRVTRGLNILNAVTIVTVSLNLAFIVALLALIPFRLHRTFCMLITLCWLLTFLLWAFFGLYYFFGKFAGDTCIALHEYWQNPENSTLDTILPCNDHRSVEILHDVGERIYDLIQQVNSNITSLRFSLSELEYICNPFSGPPEYDYHPENCSSKTIRIGDISKIIERFACLGSRSGGACKPGEFIPARIYGKVQLYTDSMQDILDSYLGMKSLVDCQLVKDAFSLILFNHCKPLNKYVHISWASLATLSTMSVLLIVLYTSEAHQKIEFGASDRSVKPHPMLYLKLVQKLFVTTRNIN